MDRERQHKQAFVEILKDPAYLWARGAGVRRRNNWHEGGLECLDLFATVRARAAREA